MGLPALIVPEALDEHVSAEGPSGKRSRISQMEVLAFDSTFIEITTDVESLLLTLRDRFGGAIVAE
jgi:Holliday junction resolvasome RuvABC ATP-dependent DNA helicase subunit